MKLYLPLHRNSGREEMAAPAAGLFKGLRPLALLLPVLLLLFLLAVQALLFTGTLMANNINVQSVSLTGGNTTDGYTMVQFDLSWDNSWRTNNLNGDGVTNWDAAWVFVKYRISTANGGDDLWKHAWLNNDGHSFGTGTGATIDAGLQTPGTAFHATTNPGIGVFIYRSADGTGTFSITGAQLRWNYDANSVADNAIVDVKVFAIEMVYVAGGAFAAGSGGSEAFKFTLTTISTDNATTVPSGTGSLGGAAGGYPTGKTAPANASWPNGFAAFYCMKYEISQQQYVDFLNTLTQPQADFRKHTVSSSSYAITGSAVGSYATTKPYVACNYLSWMDGAAYSDWAGLRPMTELEFEKACRGTIAPVANEYAWGNTTAIAAVSISYRGLANEIPSNADANAAYNNLAGGPLRVGAFASGSSTRAQSGASYYGIMELSGNLWERPVTVGDVAGGSYTGIHGNGALNSAGDADVDYWPGINGNSSTNTANGVYGGTSGVTNVAGSGYRGGSWGSENTYLRVSDRISAENSSTSRAVHNGFRAVRGVQ